MSPWTALARWRDLRAAARGPRPFAARQARKPLLRWIVRNIR
jgi:hypothetical protein